MKRKISAGGYVVTYTIPVKIPGLAIKSIILPIGCNIPSLYVLDTTKKRLKILSLIVVFESLSIGVKRNGLKLLTEESFDIGFNTSIYYGESKSLLAFPSGVYRIPDTIEETYDNNVKLKMYAEMIDYNSKKYTEKIILGTTSELVKSDEMISKKIELTTKQMTELVQLLQRRIDKVDSKNNLAINIIDKESRANDRRLRDLFKILLLYLQDNKL